MSHKKRKDKRFSFKNANVSFTSKEDEKAKLTNISKTGFKISTNLDLKKGEIVNIAVDLSSVPKHIFSPNHFEIKIKILWINEDKEDPQMKNVCGGIFADVNDTEKKHLNSIFKYIENKKVMSDEDIEGFISELDSFLEKFRN